MSCLNCNRAIAEPWHGFSAGCKGCAARAASRSPQYRAAFHVHGGYGLLDRKLQALCDLYEITPQQAVEAAKADAEQRTAA